MHLLRHTQIKTAAWTLRDIFKNGNENNYFQETRFDTYIGDQVIGTGKIFLTTPGLNAATVDTDTNTRLQTIDLSDTATNVPNIDNTSQAETFESSNATANANVSDPLNDELRILVAYKPNGVVWSAPDVFTTMINGIINQAQYSTETSVENALVVYNVGRDFTLYVAPESVEKREYMTHRIVIMAIKGVARYMVSKRRKGWFAELNARIRNGDRWVGHLALENGRPYGQGISVEE